MISEKINKLKKLKGITNKELSELSGVPLGTLNKITAGITADPKIETLKALAKSLECTLDDFDDKDNNEIYLYKDNYALSNDKKNLLDNYDKLNPLGKEKAVERVEELTEIPKYTLDKNSEDEMAVTLDYNIEDIKKIKFYDTPVSAGTGSFISDDVPYEIMQVNLKQIPQARRCDFALKVRGDSMEPLYYDGDIVYIKEQPSLDNGQIGIFIYDGEAFMKKYCVQNDGVYLVSLNEKYAPIKLDEHTPFKICGLVL